MARRVCTFREADLVRALRAASKAKVRVRVEIEPGRMTVVPIDDEPGNNKQAEDEVERWLGKHAHRS